MTIKYHINKNGVPSRCTAKPGNCPLGEDSNHFESKEEAQAVIDKTNEEKYGIILGLQAGMDKLNNKVDEVESNIKSRTKGDGNNPIDYKERQIQLKLDILESQLNHKVETGEEFTIDEIKDRAKLVDEVVAHYLSVNDTSKTHTVVSATGKVRYERERAMSHEKFILMLEKEFEDVPNEGKVVISAGMPGAGKTYAIQQTGDVDLNKYAVINSDDFKEMLAEADMIPEVRGLTKMERVSFIHEESSHLFEEMGDSLRSQKKNIVLDLTCSNLESTIRRVDRLKKDGYNSEDITMICVRADPNTCSERASSRHQDGMNGYIRGDNNVGGRFVPQDVLDSCLPKRGLVDSDDPSSKKYPTDALTSSEQVYELLMNDDDIGIKGIMYDNSVFGKEPRRIEEKTYL